MGGVTIRGISKSYTRGTMVLPPLDLDIADGELFFLLGPSGCGKSTLLRILAGLVTPDAGSIAFGSRDVTYLPPEKRHAAMVFQNYALWPHMTVAENVAFAPQSTGASRTESARRTADALAVVRMSDMAGRRVTALSGGQQQRVALARALAAEPELLLLDEPLSNLDARLRDEMRVEIRRICKERHLTALYVTHDRNEALSMADRLAVMREGRICQLGSPTEVYRRPASRFTASFLGDVNFIAGEADGRGGFATPIGVFALTGAAAGRSWAAVRPESIHFADQNAPGAFPARLVGRAFFGDRTEYRAETAAGTLVFNDSSYLDREKGEDCFLALSGGLAVVTE
ncbi:MAG: ABC transporter ATP-binding protein [Victivallaceae bacterium]|nr:ABC transporter ATP-binding protein [Victivallaceae bacterium]